MRALRQCAHGDDARVARRQQAAARVAPARARAQQQPAALCTDDPLMVKSSLNITIADPK